MKPECCKIERQRLKNRAATAAANGLNGKGRRIFHDLKSKYLYIAKLKKSL
ncbi:hypothetical protein HMP0721_2410 [Pseudoramibacter alactolyticus ATCC 23263]|uniref:Uncharacterized protein n=1 Tax=Pseudoramibacter alactolyticus ATCC 23263 TaxID=887929 RepID=E6MK74_9FIRM|nr:hypothetical protein HMP0721_2410 [Pseudoramibacter alactolyticus ATCC 23263]